MVSRHSERMVARFPQPLPSSFMRLYRFARHFTIALGLLLSGMAPAYASTEDCWNDPLPQSLEETAIVLGNRSERPRRQSWTRRVMEPSVLALSSGGLRTAHGAGLLAGWSETGFRPDFKVVTAAGAGALIAPFAFAGPDADQTLAELFNCEASSMVDLAKRAASLIDGALLERIARKHEAGGRLLIALQGSPAREEMVWDIGLIAASRHPSAQESIRNILRAAVDLVTRVELGDAGVQAASSAKRNWTFRQFGSGQEFLAPVPEADGAKPASVHLIYNGVLSTVESAEYIAGRREAGTISDVRADMPVVPAFDLYMQAQRQKAHFRFAAMKPAPSLGAPAAGTVYFRNLFLRGYRQARMDKLWQKTLPGAEEAGLH